VGHRDTIRAANALPGADGDIVGMVKTESSSRVHIVVAGQGVGAKSSDPAIRRFRLARLRVDGRPADAGRARPAQSA
jgi:hypothetical protein